MSDDRRERDTRTVDSDYDNERETRQEYEEEREGRREQDVQESTAGERLLGWFTETMLRVALAVVGLVLLLVALGQIVGVDTIGLLSDALASEVVQWTLVAVFALLLIVAATKRWGFTDETGSRR